MNTSLNKLLLLLVGLSISFTALSQENFVSGYVIKLNGDTLKGLVDYRNWSKNPSEIRFKELEKSGTTNYNPLQIVAFGVLDEIYKSAVIKADNSNIYILSDSPYFEFRTDTVFLQTLFQGQKSLYLYKDKFDRNNFYMYNNLKFELLEYKTYIKKNDIGHEFLQKNRRYIGQLLFYFKDCPGISSKLKGVDYTTKDLQNIYQYYFSKMVHKTYLSRTNEKTRFVFGAVAGLSMIDLKFKSGSTSGTFDNLINADFNKKFSFAGGVSMNIIFPRNNGKWSLYNELVGSSDVTSDLYTDFKNAEYYQKHDMKIGSYYLKMNNMIRFKYPVSKYFLFVNAGISNGYSIKEVNTDIIEDHYYSENKVINSKVLDDTRKYEQGLLLGTGIISNRFSMEFRYEGGTGMSPYLLLKSNAHRFNLLFGYQF